MNRYCITVDVEIQAQTASDALDVLMSALKAAKKGEIVLLASSSSVVAPVEDEEIRLTLADEREAGDDDGREYADPRDEAEDRRRR